MISRLEDFKTYNLAMELGETVWKIVNTWGYFERDTIGKQLVRSVDSIAANLSEGFGRYHYKESKNFGYFSRGSLFETETWLTKAYTRSLISTEQFKKVKSEIDLIGKMLNNYISSISKVNEPSEPYGSRPIPDA